MEKLKKLVELRKLQRENQRMKKKLKKLEAIENGIPPKTGPTRKQLRKNKVEFSSAKYSVAVDLSFDQLMTEKDVASCCSQLLRIYTANRRAKRPIPIHFTSLKEGTKLHKKFETHEGAKNWDISRHTESFLELFDKEKIVYLTSESENVLTELEDGCIYILGGIVDHNQQKGLTANLAKQANIKSARFPLSEHIIMPSRSVLTINQCFEILLGISEGKTWKEILMEVLPKRKMPKLKDDVISKNAANSKESKQVEAKNVNEIDE